MTTPINVAQSAAIPDALPLDELTLIGLFSAPSGHAALLRNATSEIARVTPGDRAFGVQIHAVDDQTCIVADARGTHFALQMPQG